MSCPACGEDVAPVLMGYPSEDARRAAARGEVVLGGCLVWGDTPADPVACPNCQWHGQVVDGQLRTAPGQARTEEIRVVTWNCRNSLTKHPEWLDLLDWDVAVIQECVADDLARFGEGRWEWNGYGSTKGMGLVARNDHTIRELEPPTEAGCHLAVEILDRSHKPQFTLLGIWTVKLDGDGRASYAQQFAQVIDQWHDRIRDGRVVIAGDVNTALELASPSQHRRDLERLAALGVRSAFHEANGVGMLSPRPDDDGTLQFGPKAERRWCHCDYVFVSNSIELAGGHLGPVE